MLETSNRFCLKYNDVRTKAYKNKQLDVKSVEYYIDRCKLYFYQDYVPGLLITIYILTQPNVF